MSTKHDGWSQAIDALDVLFAAAREFRGSRSIGDALCLDLKALAENLGLEAIFNSIEIDELTDRRLASSTIARLNSVHSGLTSTQRTVLRERRLNPHPSTLQSIATRMGMTRERIRQIDAATWDAFGQVAGSEMDAIVGVVASTLEPITPDYSLNQTINRLFDDGNTIQPVVDVARVMFKERLGYLRDASNWYSREAQAIAIDLRNIATEAADDVGLIPIPAMRDALPDVAWNDYFKQLMQRCGFHQIGSHWAIRATKKARAKAALLELGRVSTKEEIAAVSGLDPKKVGGQLSVVPSIVRADKTRWGLNDWIDDVYEGIPQEIVQRIDEGGGATPVRRLLEELPARFGVSELSVRAYMSTPQFEIRDGFVSVADVSSIRLRDLDDVIDGRDSHGNPFYTFEVEDRYFDGFSLLGFPPELAKELGCKPNGTISVQVDYPKGCKNLSIVWRLTSTTGASVGYIGQPLQQLGASSGDRVQLVIHGSQTVEFRPESSLEFDPDRAQSSALSIMERIKNRRRVL